MLAPWKKICDKPRQHIKKQRHYFVNRCLYSQSYVFVVINEWVWELNHKEGWAPKNWCFQIVEKTLESSLDCKEIQPVHPKGNQSWISIGRSDAESPIFWPPDAKSWLWKDPYMGKDWGQEEKGMAEDKMVGCHHWLTRQEFQQTLGDSEGQGSLACCSPWVCSVRHNIATGQQQQQNAFLFSSFYFYELCVYTLLSWIHFMIAGDFHLCFIVSPGLVTDVFQNISFLYKAHVCLSPPQ